MVFIYMSFVYTIDGNLNSLNNKFVEPFTVDDVKILGNKQFGSDAYEIESFSEIIEHFGGINIGNKDTTTDTTLIKEATNIQESLNENSVIEGCASLLSNVINEVASKNMSDLTKLFSASNTISIENVKAKKKFSYSSEQTATIDLKQQEEINQTLSAKILNDINKSLKDGIKKMVDAQRNREKVNEETKQNSTDIGSTLNGVGQTVGDTLSDIMDMSIGNTTSDSKALEINKEFNKKMQINRNFEFKKDDKVVEELSNRLSMDNISKAIKDTKSGNDLSLSNIDAGGNVNVMGVKQEAAVNAVIKNIYNQTVLIEISTKIITNYDYNVNEMIKSADSESDITKKLSTSGDIYAAGVAGKQVLEGAGEAAKGFGEGVGTAAEGTGKGVATGAKGIGEGAASLFGAMTGPLLAIGVGLIVCIIIYFYGKNQGWF